jgi:hypothetical protein
MNRGHSSQPEGVGRRRRRAGAEQKVMRRSLSRLGVEISAPSASALTELHRAHVELVPYETFWLFDTLDDTFGLQFAVSRDAIDRLWSRVRAAHRVWLETSAQRATEGS